MAYTTASAPRWRGSSCAWRWRAFSPGFPTTGWQLTTLCSWIARRAGVRPAYRCWQVEHAEDCHGRRCPYHWYWLDPARTLSRQIGEGPDARRGHTSARRRRGQYGRYRSWGVLQDTSRKNGEPEYHPRPVRAAINGFRDYPDHQCGECLLFQFDRPQSGIRPYQGGTVRGRARGRRREDVLSGQKGSDVQGI